MSLYPMFVNLDGRPVLVVGGGEVAERKVRALLKTDARIRVGAPRISPQLVRWAQDGCIEHWVGHFTDNWLDGAWLVIAATNEQSINRRIAAVARTRRLWVNVVDDAELSSYHVPAIVDRSPLMVAISSSGAAPVLARRIRETLETLLDPSLGKLVALADRYRPRIRERFQHMPSRHRFYNWLLDGPVARLLQADQPLKAEQTLTSRLDAATPGTTGLVTLVGAGPGDPGLLTLKALRCLNEAEIILHDRLVSDEILELARRDAVRIDMGKRVGENHSATQQRIHDLMLKHARDGRRVVRLKGGDSLVFGRGGEELEFLRSHDIAYQVVPGISAAMACAAYAGVPLTHREHAQSLHLTTIGRKHNLAERDWAMLARQHQTLAIYMGVAKLEVLTRRLLAHGRAGSTPFALVENGTRLEQRVVTGTLDRLPALARQNRISAPAMLIIGEVAALAPRLAWYGHKQAPSDALYEVA